MNYRLETLNSVVDGVYQVRNMGSWNYAGVMGLTLEGFAVQVSLSKDQPWLMPFAIEKAVSAWKRCGVSTVAELRQCLAERPADLENELKMEQELGELQDTIHTMLELLQVEYTDLHTACRWAEASIDDICNGCMQALDYIGSC